MRSFHVRKCFVRSLCQSFVNNTKMLICKTKYHQNVTAYSFKVNQSTKPVSFVCLNFALFAASKHRPQQQNHSQTNIIHAVKCQTLFWFANRTISMKILLWNQHFFRWEKIVNFQTTNLCLIVSLFFHSTDLVHWFWIFVQKLELCSLQRIDTHSSFPFKL